MTESSRVACTAWVSVAACRLQARRGGRYRIDDAADRRLEGSASWRISAFCSARSRCSAWFCSASICSIRIMFAAEHVGRPRGVADLVAALV